MLIRVNTIWVTFESQNSRSKFTVTERNNVAYVVGATSSDNFLVCYDSLPQLKQGGPKTAHPSFHSYLLSLTVVLLVFLDNHK